MELLVFYDQSHCKENEYFNPFLLHCELCDANKKLVSSSDKLSCVCNSQSKTIPIPEYTILSQPICDLCKNNTFPSSDGLFCMSCPENKTNHKNKNMCTKCKENEILVEREVNGLPLKNPLCVPCKGGTIPSKSKGQCISCPIINPITEKHTIKDCACPPKNSLFDNICVPNSLLPEWPDNKSSYMIEYHSGEKIESKILGKYLRSSIYACKLKNSTACEIAANLCTLIHFQDHLTSPCKLWKDLRQGATVLPWLFYEEGDAVTVLNRKKIGAEYTLDNDLFTSWINLSTIVVTLEGHFLSMNSLKENYIDFCPESRKFLQHGIRFGVNIHYSCNIFASEIVNKKTLFFIPYLHYTESNKNYLYPIPILIRNLPNHQNQDDDMINWLLVHRFFLIDTISSIPEKSDKPILIKYVKSFQIRVKVRGNPDLGKIYPPYIVLEYGEISQNEIESNTILPFDFFVTFEMDNDSSHAIEITVGVFSSLAVLYSCIQTWSYCRRSGKILIDFRTIISLLLFACGNLANVFFVIACGASVHVFIFFKGQNVVHTLLPNKYLENTIRDYIIVAFSLKLIEIFCLLFTQININIFLIDWEKTRPQESIIKPPDSTLSSTNLKDNGHCSVSIWRTYFIANKLNELQIKRKINLYFHLILVGLFLEIIGLKYWATADPDLHTSSPDYLEHTPLNKTCRLAVGVITYFLLYIIQLFITTSIYERYIKNSIQEFIDVCSMANISVFILKLNQFGFYIHGRSVHGFADTDMASMIIQLQREENNLCEQRGLNPGTDQQTFSMIVPLTLYDYYCKLMSPVQTIPKYSLKISGLSLSDRLGKVQNETIEKSIQAYTNINMFLSAFLQHAIKDLDYEIRDKQFIESLLDIELNESIDRAIFYTENKPSFVDIFFYGNEYILASFDLIVFIFIELMFQNFVLAIFITAINFKIISWIRQVGGCNNLAKKAFIDKRFLV